jgi:hypothetical protein
MIPEHIRKNKDTYYRKWLIYAPIGLILTGAGLCVFGTALFKMRDGVPFMEWFIWGTASLAIFNAGLSFFGQAVKFRVFYELSRKE